MCRILGFPSTLTWVKVASNVPKYFFLKENVPKYCQFERRKKILVISNVCFVLVLGMRIAYDSIDQANLFKKSAY